MNENRPVLKMKEKEKVRRYINNDGLYLQALLSSVVVILAVVTFFLKDLYVLTELFLALLMFTMAYNNETSYARNRMTLVYVLCGFFVLFMMVFGFFF